MGPANAARGRPSTTGAGTGGGAPSYATVAMGGCRVALLLALMLSQRAAAYQTPPPPSVRFPTPATHPMEVTLAQLNALRTRNMPRTFGLFSRARRLQIEDDARRDMREKIGPEDVHEALIKMLRRECPGLVGHSSAEIVNSLGDPEPARGLLPKWTLRVKVDGGERHFLFTLTRQSDFDGGDPRDKDGFEKCWLVWNIAPDDDRGGDGAVVDAPPSAAKTLSSV